jgi:hypothetical protein
MISPWFVALTTTLQRCVPSRSPRALPCPLGYYITPQHIEYAKTKSYATLQKEDPNFVHPSLSKNLPAASSLANGLSVEKRERDDDEVETERDRKRGKYENEEEVDEMDIEEEDGRPPGDANGHSGEQSWPIQLLHRVIKFQLFQ